MGQQIGAPGQYLPTGQFGNPANTGPIQVPGNTITLQPGMAIPVPPGSFEVSPGLYSFIQFLDPVTQTWRTHNSARDKLHRVTSDGLNIRVANQLGCPVAAIVTVGGSGYAQASTTVTPSVGNSTWQAIVGGMTSVVSVATAGAGYGIPPLVEIAPPPAPGVQAAAYAVLTGGSVSSVVLSNVGAGYTSIPEVRIVPNPTDPNINTGITQASVSLALAGGTASSGSIAAILCTNPGVSVASVPTLTIAGAGASGAATAVRLTTMTGGSVAAGGAGFVTSGVTTVGGRPSATPQYTNPATDLSGFVPRPAQADLFASGGSLISISSVYDGGLFAGTPTVIVMPGAGNLQTTTASVTGTFGTANDTIIIQPSV